MVMFRNLSDWFWRIHIGKLASDRKAWQHAVESVALKWLGRSPSVEGQTTDVEVWQKAGLVLGLGEQLPVSEKSRLSCWLTAVSEQDMRPEHLLLAYALHIQTDAINAYVESFKESTIPYRDWVKDIRFVDTLGMIVPYLHTIGNDALALRQLAEYDAAMLKGLYPAHAFDLSLGLPLGVFDWGRGCGWYILSLIEADDLSGNDERVVRLAKALLPLQRENGWYGAFLFVRGSRNESSCTSLIGRLMVKAYELTKDRAYLQSACLCEKALMTATRRNGAIDYCQGDTHGIGNYSLSFSVMPFVQGMALKLSKEIDVHIDAHA